MHSFPIMYDTMAVNCESLVSREFSRFAIFTSLLAPRCYIRPITVCVLFFTPTLVHPNPTGTGGSALRFLSFARWQWMSVDGLF